MTPNQQILDRLLRHKVLALGYAKTVVDEVVLFLDATEPQLQRALLDIFSTPHLGVAARLRRAESQVVRIRGAAWNKLSDAAVEAMVRLAHLEPKVLSQALGVKIAPPSDNVLTRLVNKTLVAGNTIKEWFKSLKELDLKRLVGQVRLGILAGESVGDVLKRITGRLSMVANAAKRAVRMVVETAVGAVSSVVRGALDDVRGLGDWELWVSILDSRTTVWCRELSGRTFRVGSGPLPGFHAHCRSERVPLLKDGGDYNVRSYGEWIPTQPPWFRRYAGKVFNVMSLKPLSLNQLLETE